MTRRAKSALRPHLRPAGALGLVVAALAATAVTGASAANAGSLGTLTAAAATGSVTYTPFSLVTSGLCPAGTEYINAWVNNPAAGWNDVLMVGTTDLELPNLNTSGIPAVNTIGSIATDQTPALSVPDGTYTVSLHCQVGIIGPEVVGTFDGAFTVVGDTYTFDPLGPAS